MEHPPRCGNVNLGTLFKKNFKSSDAKNRRNRRNRNFEYLKYIIIYNLFFIKRA